MMELNEYERALVLNLGSQPQQDGDEHDLTLDCTLTFSTSSLFSVMQKTGDVAASRKENTHRQAW